MKQFPVRPVLAGVLIAAAIALASFFLLKAALFILLIGGAAKLLGYGGRGRWMQRLHRSGGIGWSQPFRHRHPFAAGTASTRTVTID